MRTVNVVATLIAAAATASAQGTAQIVNHCEFETYLWAVDAERNPSSPTIIGPGETYSEQYHTPSYGGVSMKISKSNDLTIVTQLEYTIGDQLYYDGSNINCQTANCPFWEYNMYIESSESSCPARPCPAQTACPGFYQQPDDNEDTLACSISSNTILHLCVPQSILPTAGDSVNLDISGLIGSSGSSSSQSSPAASPAAPAKSSSAAPSPSPKATTTQKPQLNERPVATTFVTVTQTEAAHHRQAREIHAHARRHMHQHNQI